MIGAFVEVRPSVRNKYPFGYVLDGNGCWLWTGTVQNKGYGVIPIGHRRRMLAHRWMWEQQRGPIPPDVECDHLCRTPLCINPNHIELVTHRTNCLRGVSTAAQRARQTHCMHGHVFDEANTWYDRYGYRHCRTCHRLNASRHLRERPRVPPPPRVRPTHCAQGHPLALPNLTKRGQCRICVNAAQTRRRAQCPAGHPYEEGNIVWLKNGRRRCRRCAEARRQTA